MRAIGLCLVGVVALAGCVQGFREAAHERITEKLACASAEVKLTELPEEHVYSAEGCGRRGVYRCFHKRHLKASGARYVVCERVEVRGAASEGRPYRDHDHRAPR